LPQLPELLWNLQIWLALAGATGIPLLVLAHFLPRGRPFLPVQRCRAAPWTVVEVGLAFVVYLCWPLVLLVCKETLRLGGFFTWLYGPGFAGNSSAAQREVLWTAVLTCPFQVLALVNLVRSMSGAHLYQLGLTGSRLKQNLVVGWLGWLIVTPPVLALHVAVLWIYTAWLHVRPEEHALIKLAQDHLLAVEWVLVLLSAIVVAPIQEELLFRGIMQPWLLGRSRRSDAVMAIAFGCAILFRSDKLKEAFHAGSVETFLHELTPAGFVLLLIPCYLGSARLFRRWFPPRVTRAFFATSLLFAMFHASVWPTPVPLFFLALALSYLSYRTQSLVPAVLLHALFNAVASIDLVLTQSR
jgi:membrane protease YdiL (CAAX protease family)